MKVKKLYNKVDSIIISKKAGRLAKILPNYMVEYLDTKEIQVDWNFVETGEDPKITTKYFRLATAEEVYNFYENER